MKFGFVEILFVVFLEVLPVYSECDSVLGCIQEMLFGPFDDLNSTITQVGDVDVPGFENVNLSDSVDSILKNISSFFEALVDDYDLSSPFKVFYNNDNKTTIIVKSININDFEDFDDINIDYKNKTITTNTTPSNENNNLKNTKDDVSTKKQMQNVTQKSFIKATKETQKPVLDINELSKKVKQNEISDVDYFETYYDSNDNSTDYPIIDYIDLYKDTTNEYVKVKLTTVSTSRLYDEKENVQTTTVHNIIHENTNNRVYTDCSNATKVVEDIFPWVVAIFIKNETSHQYDYYCDGALLSDTVIVTAASCIHEPNATSNDLLVILGKRSLRVMTDEEIVSKIKEILIHDNFTDSEHDIAILVMEEPVTLSDRVQPARLGGGRGESATTGWAVSGNLTLIPFEENKAECNEKLPANAFCAIYGNDVTVCPSFGGLYATRQTNGWFLRGIRTADPTNRSFCVDRSLVYTDLNYYINWINVSVK